MEGRQQNEKPGEQQSQNAFLLNKIGWLKDKGDPNSEASKLFCCFALCLENKPNPFFYIDDCFGQNFEEAPLISSLNLPLLCRLFLSFIMAQPFTLPPLPLGHINICPFPFKGCAHIYYLKWGERSSLLLGLVKTLNKHFEH
jgi:hypothetical protein